MKEFKFRAWHKKAESFLCWDWLKGLEKGFHIMVPVRKGKDKKEDVVHIEMSHQKHFGDASECIWEDTDLILEQDTGLKDKKGVDIYEGDICAMLSSVRKEIIFKDGAFGWMDLGDFITFGGHSHFDKIMENIEVVGNIHENPELLED